MFSGIISRIAHRIVVIHICYNHPGMMLIDRFDSPFFAPPGHKDTGRKTQFMGSPCQSLAVVSVCTDDEGGIIDMVVLHDFMECIAYSQTFEGMMPATEGFVFFKYIFTPSFPANKWRL